MLTIVKSWLPKRLTGQLILLLLSTLTFSQLFTLFFFLSESDYIAEQIETKQLIRRAAQAVNVLATVPDKHHKAMLKAMSVHRVKFYLSQSAETDNTAFFNEKSFLAEQLLLRQMLNKKYSKVYVHQDLASSSRIATLLEYLYQKLTEPTKAGNKNSKRLKLFSTAIELKNKQWLMMSVYSRDPFPLWAKTTLISLLIMSLVLIVIVVLSVKRIIRPLNELADNAKKLGLGESIEPIQEQGPEDVQHAVKAFNQMLLRLNKMVTHRARSLAAMSHDLRTPLTSMRLHAEFISDEVTQDKIIEKLDEMEHITKATISFAKQDSWLEKSRKVDICALIESLCLDLSDIGLNVTCDITDKINYSCRPVALKRAFSNLIENGVKYGKSVDVSIFKNDKSINIIIADQGQGIPEAEQQRMFEAFERLDDSRNQNSGGMGLGMTIALTAIQDHGGEIKLKNRVEKGLDVIVQLPLN